MSDELKTSVIQKVFRSDITAIVSILAVGWAVVTTIILPIQSMQIQLTQVQSELADQKTQYATILISQATQQQSLIDVTARVTSLEKKLTPLNVGGK